MNELIIYSSPVISGLLAWMIVNYIKETQSQITEVKGHVGQALIAIAEMRKDIEYIKGASIKYDDKFDDKVVNLFEDNIVKVIKRAKTRFE